MTILFICECVCLKNLESLELVLRKDKNSDDNNCDKVLDFVVALRRKTFVNVQLQSKNLKL